MTTGAERPPAEAFPSAEPFRSAEPFPPAEPVPPADAVPPAAAVLLACTRDPGDARTATALRAALARVASAPPAPASAGVAASGYAAGAGARASAAGAVAESGWGALADAALRHGMSGLLYRRVVDLAYEAVPQAVLLGWRERAVAAGQRSLRMQRQFLPLLVALQAAGVPALAYKGPAVSQQLYGDAGLRHFSDLDVLVRPETVVAARDVALSLGFTERYAFDAVPLSLLQDAEQEIGLVHPETGLHLDLHWRVGPRFAADSLLAEELFARSATVRLLEREVRALGPHDVVLTLTIHASVHGWLKLEDVAAVAAALRRLTPAEAATLPALALEHGCQRRLHVGVLLASTLAEETLPALLTRPAHDDRRAKDIASRAGARLVWSVTAPQVLDESDPRARAKGVLWEAVGLDSGPAAAKHLWRRLTTAGARDWPESAPPAAAPGEGSEEAPAPRSRPGPVARLRTIARRQRRIWRPPGSGGH